MLPFPRIISLVQKYTHHVVDVHDVRSLQQFLRTLSSQIADARRLAFNS